jgi:XTP/dITP diphosphohydrolase
MGEVFERVNASKQQELLIATRNAHKTREFAALLGSRFAVRDLTTAGRELPEIAETGSTFEENATLKAAGVSQLLPDALVLADDSGLEVEALGGRPGVYSARYAGPASTDAENIARLLNELKNTTSTNRQAQFRCVLALARAGELLHLAQGVVRGRITDVPSGAGGFGYDPVFVPAGFSESFAALPPEVKNKISHRANAVADLLQYLR